MDGQQGRQRPESGKNLIKIPSYQEVFGTTSSSSSAPTSYNPPLPATAGAAASSSSFSEAFSFLKSSEFYSPPAPPPPQPSTAPRYQLPRPLLGLSQSQRRPTHLSD
jgi:DNA excision repair protein ERCC-1